MKTTSKERILNAALEASKASHFTLISLPDVARRAGCSHSLISYFFKTIGALRDELVRHAIETKDLRVLMQALSAGSEIARGAPEDLKNDALNLMR